MCLSESRASVGSESPAIIQGTPAQASRPALLPAATSTWGERMPRGVGLPAAKRAAP